ncbi:hypothetical protein PanWU01x14_194710, partial [Parasponia andersonii]
MVAYLQKAQGLVLTFSTYNIKLIRQSQNIQADALVKLASTKDDELLKIVSVEFLAKPSIEENSNVALMIIQKFSWFDPNYLNNGNLPKDKDNVKRLRIKVAWYLIYDGQLYRKSFNWSSLLCVDDEKVLYIMREVYEEIGGNNSG